MSITYIETDFGRIAVQAGIPAKLGTLDQATRLMQAAGAMSRRSEHYMLEAMKNERWFYWGMRSVRAGKASVRLHARADRIMRAAMADGAPIAVPLWSTFIHTTKNERGLSC